MFTFKSNKLIAILLIPLFLLALQITDMLILPEYLYIPLIALLSLLIGVYITYTFFITKIDRLAQLSDTDTTTGLYRSESVRKLLNYDIERSKRYKRDFSIILLSIDDLDSIDEVHGKQQVESVLKLLSSIIMKGIKYINKEEKEFHGIRNSDIAFRYEKEGKILVVMPETDAKGAFIAAERIREAVLYTPFAKLNEGEDLRVTLSAGVVSFDSENDTIDTLLQRVDLLLLKAKITNNHVVIENPIHNGLVVFGDTNPSC